MGKRALVLSGGGMFGVWQAGAWSVLAAHFQPELIVGASVGSLSGYAIAAGCTSEELLELWRRPQGAGFRKLPGTIRELVERRPLRMEFAVVLLNALHMREEWFSGPQVTWRHLVASCAVPGMMRPQRLGANWYVDGGLLNVLPVPAAVALGATEILALNVLPESPLPVLRPFLKLFRAVFRKKFTIPPGVAVTTLIPPKQLGSFLDACSWNAANVERWYIQGIEDATAAIQRRLIPSDPLHNIFTRLSP
jgi:predicted acylesterase/phospholipase RssA